MAQGLEVFNEQGLSVFNSADRVVRIIGVITGSEAAPSSGSVSVPLEYFNNNTLLSFLFQNKVNFFVKTLSISEYNSILYSGEVDER